MSLRALPAAKNLARPEKADWDPPADALCRWAERPQAAEATDPGVISIYDVIGSDWYGDGWTSKRLAGVLRSIGGNPVTVNINSPGGDVFEGIGIYNLLREHPAKVTVKVMGLAASAASIIAMAGDEILMGTGTEMMVHKAWGMVVGNSDDFAAAVDIFKTFDSSLAEIYAARTGKTEAEILKLLAGGGRGADGTWMTASEAVAQGFADGMMPDAAGSSAPAAIAAPGITARRRVDALLAQTGLPRGERRRLVRDIAGTPRAADDAMPSAGDDLAAPLRQLLATLRT